MGVAKTGALRALLSSSAVTAAEADDANDQAEALADAGC
jgi:hypothetical protein